jgi:hypothetical protein
MDDRTPLPAGLPIPADEGSPANRGQCSALITEIAGTMQPARPMERKGL